MAAAELVYKTLQSVAHIQTAVVFRDKAPQQTPEGNVRGLAIRDVLSTQTLDWLALPRVLIEDKHLIHCLQPGDVLLPSRGDYYRARLYDGPPGRVFPLGHLTVIRPGHLLQAAYLTWYLNLSTTQARIPGLLTGSNIKALTKAALSTFEIEVPDRARQDQIAQLYGTTARIGQLRLRINQLEQLEMTQVTQQILRQGARHVG